MPNMTITADEETLQRARVEAAKRNISLSRFVGEMLREKFQEDDEYDRAMQAFFSRDPYLESQIRDDGRSWPRRDELYERPVLK